VVIAFALLAAWELVTAAGVVAFRRLQGRFAEEL